MTYWLTNALCSELWSIWLNVSVLLQTNCITKKMTSGQRQVKGPLTKRHTKQVQTRRRLWFFFLIYIWLFCVFFGHFLSLWDCFVSPLWTFFASFNWALWHCLYRVSSRGPLTSWAPEVSVLLIVDFDTADLLLITRKIILLSSTTVVLCSRLLFLMFLSSSERFSHFKNVVDSALSNVFGVSLMDLFWIFSLTMANFTDSEQQLQLTTTDSKWKC